MKHGHTLHVLPAERVAGFTSRKNPALRGALGVLPLPEISPVPGA